MAQFEPFEAGVEVNGHTILAFVNALPAGQDNRLAILKKHGIEPEPNQWYTQQGWLDAFRDVSTGMGENALYMIGKAIPENADFPPEIKSLEQALASIDEAYHMNHRGGEIGHYRLTAFHGSARQAVMVCNNPYPSSFDKGIITTMLRKFAPDDAKHMRVELDGSKETRLNGADSCTYIVSW